MRVAHSRKRFSCAFRLDEQLIIGSPGVSLKLKGQFMLLESKEHLLFLGSPYVTNIPELLQYNMFLNSIPVHDATRDLILLNQQRLNDVEVK